MEVCFQMSASGFYFCPTYRTLVHLHSNRHALMLTKTNINKKWSNYCPTQGKSQTIGQAEPLAPSARTTLFPWLPTEGVGGLGVYSHKVIRQTYNAWRKAKHFGHVWEKAVSTPTQTSLSLESALSLIYGIKGNNQQSELKKRRAHGVRQRAVLLYWRRDLMKRPIPSLGFLETWHYKRVTERPLNPCQVCVCVGTCWPW